MIWLAIAVLLTLSLAPVALAIRRIGRTRGRREAALTLHRAQLLELDRDLAERRIGVEDHQTARLEVQRRLLAAAESPDAVATADAAGSRWPLLATLLLVPVVTVVLYQVGGRPDLAVPVGERPSRNAAEDAALIEQLRAVIARMDPHSEQALQGNTLLAGAEEARGNDAAAAAAWRAALNAHFDPEVAARAAEAITRAAKQVTPEAAALYRQALAAAPPDAPWRPLVQQRLQQMK